MSRIQFINGTVILPDRLFKNSEVLCESGMILYVGKARKGSSTGTLIDDAQVGYISPGFIDIHIHGGAGSDFMDGTLDAVQTVCRAHAKHGTTTLFPTTTTGTHEQIMAMLKNCALAKRHLGNGARIAGVHLYGPYFAGDKVGCHAVNGGRSPVQLEYDLYFASGLIRIATCAAELAGAEEFYRESRRRRCLVNCAHSNSSCTEMQRAF